MVTLPPSRSALNSLSASAGVLVAMERLKPSNFGAPLASFHAKILVAQALGIVHSDNRKDLDTIRNVRNAFAHSPTHIKFNDEPVKKLCLSLTIAKSFSRVDKANSARMIYISAVASIFFNLLDYYDGLEVDIFEFATRES